jgi:hypothetical protein
MRLLCGADYPEGEVQGGEVSDEQAARFAHVEVAGDAFDHLAVVEAGVFVAGDFGRFCLARLRPRSCHERPVTVHSEDAVAELLRYQHRAARPGIVKSTGPRTTCGSVCK